MSDANPPAEVFSDGDDHNKVDLEHGQDSPPAESETIDKSTTSDPKPAEESDPKPAEESAVTSDEDRLIDLEHGEDNPPTTESETGDKSTVSEPKPAEESAVAVDEDNNKSDTVDESITPDQTPPRSSAVTFDEDNLADVEDVISKMGMSGTVDLKRTIKLSTAKGLTSIDITDLPASTTHRLLVKEKGESEVEWLARDIEFRRNNKISTPFHIKQRLIQTFKNMSKEKGYPRRSAVKVLDVRELRDKVKDIVSSGENYPWYEQLTELMGFRNTEKTALKILDRAVEVLDEYEEKDDEWWYFPDFMFYHTENEAYFPWFRHPLSKALFWTIFFFIATPVVFCSIYLDEGICPSDPTGQNRRYYGAVSSLYFASTTMSTVGYGDLSVSKDKRWKVFLGTLYMIVALVVAVTSFSAIIESSFNKYMGVFEGMLHKTAHYFGKCFGQRAKSEMLLYERIRLLKYVKIGDVIIQFTILNLVGIFASRFFVNADPDLDWTWMDSFYWAVQTTTTVGYGDMTMNFSMRWFQLFYLAIATYFVGYAMGKLGDLSDQLLQMKRKYAWERRETDRAMIENMQGGKDHDGRVDQFEFVVASLLLLNKISSDDIGPIMDKYRELSDDTGFIHVDDAPVHGDETDESFDEEEVFEVEALDAEGNHQGVIQMAINEFHQARASVIG